MGVECTNVWDEVSVLREALLYGGEEALAPSDTMGQLDYLLMTNQGGGNSLHRGIEMGRLVWLGRLGVELVPPPNGKGKAPSSRYTNITNI